MSIEDGNPIPPLFFSAWVLFFVRPVESVLVLRFNSFMVPKSLTGCLGANVLLLSDGASNEDEDEEPGGDFVEVGNGIIMAGGEDK